MPGGTDRLLVRVMVSFGGCGSGTLAGAGCWVVFGTLLGPEATGPWRGFSGVSLFVGVPGGGGVGLVFLVFLAAPSAHVLCVGCVVWGCCLRTT